MNECVISLISHYLSVPGSIFLLEALPIDMVIPQIHQSS